MEDPRDAQHPENDKTRQEKRRYDREQIHHSVKRDQKPQSRVRPAPIRIQILRRPDAQRIFHAEDQHGNDLDPVKHACETRQFPKRLQKCDQNIRHNCHRNKNVKHAADVVALVAGLSKSLCKPSN